MTDKGLTMRDVRIPDSISKKAQANLAAQAVRPMADLPALDDTAAWLDLVEVGNKGLAIMMAQTGMADLTTSESWDLDGVPGYLAKPKAGNVEDRILYDIHGGALYIGSGEACRLMAMGSAVNLHATVYAVDYRMPPLHPYPVPLDDCFTGYKALLERYAPERIIVRGASAGGNLAAALMLRCRDAGVPFPAALIMPTPEVDLTESGDSFEVIGAADVVLKRSLMTANLLYAAGHDLSDPLLSPLFGDFSKGFPPTLMTVGTRDRFLSNGVRMHNALRRSGNHSELLIEEAMPHGSFMGAPEDALLVADVLDFADRAWNGELAKG